MLRKAPRLVNVMAFAQSRAPELAALQAYSQQLQQQQNQQPTQQPATTDAATANEWKPTAIPRHLRRRTRSHNRYALSAAARVDRAKVCRATCYAPPSSLLLTPQCFAISARLASLFASVRDTTAATASTCGSSAATAAAPPSPPPTVRNQSNSLRMCGMPNARTCATSGATQLPVPWLIRALRPAWRLPQSMPASTIAPTTPP